MVLCIEGTKIRNKTKCTPVSKCSGNPDLLTTDRQSDSSFNKLLLKFTICIFAKFYILPAWENCD